MAMTIDGKELKIINNFDIEDIKKNVKEVLPGIPMFSDEQRNKLSIIDTAVVIAEAIICIALTIFSAVSVSSDNPNRVVMSIMTANFLGTPVTDITALSTFVVIFCFSVLAAVVLFVIYQSIILKIASKQMCKKFTEEVENATTLEAVLGVIEDVGNCANYQDMTLYRIKRHINDYLTILNNKVLSVHLTEDSELQFDIQSKDDLVERLFISVEPKEKVDIAECTLSFENWNEPVYTREYTG